MIFNELLAEETGLDLLTETVVNRSIEIINEHYDADILTPITKILSSQDTPDEKKTALADTFKPMGGVIGISAIIASMIQYLAVPTTPKEFVQLYIAMGATQTQIKQYFANSQYKDKFDKSSVDQVTKDWKEINQRFMKAGMKVNSIPGFSVKSSSGKAYTGYKGIKYFFDNLQDFQPAEVNSFIGSLKKIKSTVDSKFKVKFRDLVKDDSSGLV
jgi:hypothetical protein